MDFCWSVSVLKHDPNRAEAIFGLCMMDELEGVNINRRKDCYIKAANMFHERKPASIDHDIPNRFNYVLTLLMAEHPDAQKERVAFLEFIKSMPEYSLWLYEKALNDFNRKKMLKEIFNQ